MALASELSAAGVALLPPVVYELQVAQGHGLWRVSRVELVEELSSEYVGTIWLRTDDPTTDERELRGTSVSLLICRPGLCERRYSGIVDAVVSEGITSDGVRACRLSVIPAFKCLDEGIEWRKFVSMTVPDILRAVLREGLTPFKRSFDLKLGRDKEVGGVPYPVREYTAQRGESPYNFVRRLCAEEGLTLWYDQDGTTEKLIISDGNQHFAARDEAVKIVPPSGNNRTFEALRSFEVTCRRVPGSATVGRFDLTRPLRPLLGQAEASAPPKGTGAAGHGELYDPAAAVTLHEYQGDSYAAEDVSLKARLRLEAAQVGGQVGTGAGDLIELRPGLVFELADASAHASPLSGRHLVTRVRHVGEVAHRAPDGTVTRAEHDTTFSTIPASVPFRPAPLPRPVAVFDYAIVAAVSDEDPIHHDPHGRVKVKFWWDRSPGAPSAQDSAWIPVASPWAGQGRGVQAIPRKGDVVVINYDLGDPDRPVVTGCVNTGVNRLVHDLDNKTVVAWRSQSQRPDGQNTFSTPNYNELLMDDAAFSERFSIYAGHNYLVTALNDSTKEVGNDDSTHVKNNQSLSVDASQTVNVGGERSVTVSGSQTNTVSGSHTVTVTGPRTLTVSGGETVTVSPQQTITVNGPRTTTVNGPETVILNAGRSSTITGTDTLQVTVDAIATVNGTAALHQGATTIEVAGGHVDVNAAGWINIHNGSGSVQIDAGGNITADTPQMLKVFAADASVQAPKISLVGTQEITLTVGGSSIKIDAAGVTVTGGTITQEASGEHVVKGGPVSVNC